MPSTPVDCRCRMRQNIHGKACHIMLRIDSDDDERQVPHLVRAEITTFNYLDASWKRTAGSWERMSVNRFS